MSSYHYNPTEDVKCNPPITRNPLEVQNQDSENEAQQKQLFNQYQSEFDKLKQLLNKQKEERRAQVNAFYDIQRQLEAKYDADVENINRELKLLVEQL